MCGYSFWGVCRRHRAPESRSSPLARKEAKPGGRTAVQVWTSYWRTWKDMSGQDKGVGTHDPSSPPREQTLNSRCHRVHIM